MSGPADKTVSVIAEAWAVAADKPLVVDREKGIVTGIRVVNRRSRNFRKYPDPVTAAAAGKYNAPSNLGHHRDPATGRPLEVPPEKRFGRTFDAKPDPLTGGLTASYRYNTAHPFAGQFAWVCENDPGQLSFSPLHKVRWANGGQPDADGDMVAEAILEVFSVDLVSDGGTTATIFESFDPTTPPPESKPMDPKTLGATLDTPEKVAAFISELMKAVEASGDATLKAAMLEAVMKAGAAQPADPEAMPAESLQFLRRLPGTVGKWAAKKLDDVFVAESRAESLKWADDQIKAEGLPDALKSPVFVELVAESRGDPDKAKRIIQDRKAHAGTGGHPRTSDKDKPKTLDAWLAEAVAGK